MTIVLPDGALQSFDGELDEARLAQLLHSVAPVGRVALSLPKWTFRTASPLKDVLSALGMPTAFDERKADFSGMTAQERLLIDEVFHEAFIAVDESGTEAAAATAVVARVVSMPVIDAEMVVDRPFLFVIHDVATAVPLFIGRVTDPTAS
jgi:serpin B